MFSALISRFKKVNTDDITQLIDEINNKNLESIINLSSDSYNANFLKNNNANINELLKLFEILEKGIICSDCYYFVYDGIIQTDFDSTVHANTDLEYLLNKNCTIVNKNLEIVDISNSEFPKILDENKLISILYFNYDNKTFKFIPKDSILVKVFDDNSNEITELIDDLESINKYYFDYDYDYGELYYYRKSNTLEIIETTFFLDFKYLGN